MVTKPGTYMLCMTTMPTFGTEAGEARTGQAANRTPYRWRVAEYALRSSHCLPTGLAGGGNISNKNFHVGGDCQTFN